MADLIPYPPLLLRALDKDVDHLARGFRRLPDAGERESGRAGESAPNTEENPMGLGVYRERTLDPPSATHPTAVHTTLVPYVGVQMQTRARTRSTILDTQSSL